MSQDKTAEQVADALIRRAGIQAYLLCAAGALFDGAIEVLRATLLSHVNPWAPRGVAILVMVVFGVTATLSSQFTFAALKKRNAAFEDLRPALVHAVRHDDQEVMALARKLLSLMRQYGFCGGMAVSFVIAMNISF